MIRRGAMFRQRGGSATFLGGMAPVSSGRDESRSYGNDLKSLPRHDDIS